VFCASGSRVVSTLASRPFYGLCLVVPLLTLALDQPLDLGHVEVVHLAERHAKTAAAVLHPHQLEPVLMPLALALVVEEQELVEDARAVDRLG
jgi:hypothetical protein